MTRDLTRRLVWVAAVVALTVGAGRPARPTAIPEPVAGSGGSPRVEPNDGRHPAGELHDGVLRITLEVRRAEWCPGRPDGPCVVVPVFAEAGHAPQVPGPLIRVPTGTVIEARLVNRLADSAATLRGFETRPATGVDSIVLRPGRDTTLRFLAGAPGTYLYRGRLSPERSRQLVDVFGNEEEELAGALVVDRPGPAPHDRIFVISIWSRFTDSVPGRPRVEREALAINGRTWPYTERIDLLEGDSVHWRVVNASRRNHPMHLHGFFYRVTARGSAERDSAVAPALQPLVVTESVLPRSTIDLGFLPNRPGHWLYHCHLIYHVGPDAALANPDGSFAAPERAQHMSGLILGLRVRPRADDRIVIPPPERHLRLLVTLHAEAHDTVRSYALDSTRDGRPRVPGPPLLLTRGEPTAITVVNRLPEPTSVHWHGLELQSYSDGVPGWSGSGSRVAPMIEPGDSFTAHLVLRRAGTFIYHTHLGDEVQLVSGLYGPLIVLEPGQHFDSTTDHIFVLGNHSAKGARVLNGDSVPPPVHWKEAPTHRLRLINIMSNGRARFRLLRDSVVQQWRPVAQDGADLPTTLAVPGPAEVILDVGNTADFVLDRFPPGRYVLAMGPADGPDGGFQPIVIAPR